MKRPAEDSNFDVKELKPEMKPQEKNEEYNKGPTPLFVANVTKLGSAKRWKQNAVVNQKFMMTLDQQRSPKESEDLNIAATHAIAEATDHLIEELQIPEDYWMTLQIGSREHRRDGLTGETWKIDVGDFTKRAAMTQAVLQNLSHVLNSGEFITNDVGFSASVLFSRPERKGGKRAGASPGQKIWEQMAKESKCVCEIKNKDTLCCARAIVVMREYAKRQPGEPNTFKNISLDRGINTQQLKEAKKLHQEANVPEGLCGLDEVNTFQEYLGQQGFRIIVVDATRGGVIFKGDKYEDENKIIALVKSVYVDEQNQEKAHYDGLYSIPGFMNRSYFCKKCCKGYNSEDSAHHRCQAKNCPACKRNTANDEEECQDFTLWAKPDRSCRICKREFYGEQCFLAHFIETVEENKDMKKTRERLEQRLHERLTPILELKSTCRDFQRCPQCMVTYKVNQDFPHKCLHAQSKHCLEFVPIYQHKCYITSEEEQKFKRALQKLRSKKKKIETILGTIVEGLPDQSTQDEIDALIAQRKKKLKDLDYINMGVPMVEIQLADLQEKVIDELLDEGVSLEGITLDMVNERLPKEKLTKKIYADDLIFADIECLIDSNKTFIPILICFTKGRSKTIYHHWGTNCVSLFLDTVETWAEEEKQENGGKGKLPEYTIFFHNLKGFDGVLTTNTLYNQNLKVTDQMGTGTKMLHFKHHNLILKDSLNFFNMPLAAFPKTFGLTELKKGFFPHKFSMLEHLHYEGKIPDLKFFEPQHMSKDKKEECETWHAEQVLKGETWNFQNEMLDYCKSDVQLLPEGCLKFAQDTKNEAGFNPLTQCITIASTCHYFWRNHQMQPKTIAVEPVQGWGGLKVNQSKIALQWLYLEDLKLGGNSIKHSRNGGEQVLQIKGSRVTVDGYDHITKTVYEFQGCEYHRCRKCKPNGRHVKTFHHPDRTVEEIYQVTQRKTELLKEAGYTVKEQWECDFNKKLKQCPNLQEQIDKMSWVSPLNPREAFFGGRTGMAKCYYQAGKEEEILYEDFTSLYPTINKYGTYPIGHPHIIVNPVNQNIQDYFGIAKVNVLAPEKLLHPVLPVKQNEKLLFPLCIKCAEDQAEQPWFERTNLCPHSDKELMMTGSWCTPELLKAVEKGYQILKIHEVWHFPEDQRKEGLFAPYVNTWLKHKTEASGWPSGVETEEQNATYIHDYKEHEGIDLDPEK